MHFVLILNWPLLGTYSKNKKIFMTTANSFASTASMGLIQCVRETVPSQTSDMTKKSVLVLAPSFLLPERANSVYLLLITPLRYSRSKL